MKTIASKDLSWLKTESKYGFDQPAVGIIKQRLIILKTMLGILIVSFACILLQLF